MSEIRIGHNQITLAVKTIKFTKGSIWFEASGMPDPKKVKKLTGSQPLVLVGDDGEILAAWHSDLTDNFAIARANPENYLNCEQEWKILSVQKI